MTHYLIGLVVGATGALIGVYCAAALLPATREERPRDPNWYGGWWSPEVTTSGGTTWRPDSDKWTITVTQ
jgi:hypothetical protein